MIQQRFGLQYFDILKYNTLYRIISIWFVSVCREWCWRTTDLFHTVSMESPWMRFFPSLLSYFELIMSCLLSRFTGSVKLKSIIIKGGPGDSCPAKLKAQVSTCWIVFSLRWIIINWNDRFLFFFRFINREDIDFSTVERITPTQEWDLVQTGELVEYQTK